MGSSVGKGNTETGGDKNETNSREQNDDHKDTSDDVNDTDKSFVSLGNGESTNQSENKNNPAPDRPQETDLPKDDLNETDNVENTIINSQEETPLENNALEERDTASKGKSIETTLSNEDVQINGNGRPMETKASENNSSSSDSDKRENTNSRLTGIKEEEPSSNLEVASEIPNDIQEQEQLKCGSTDITSSPKPEGKQVTIETDTSKETTETNNSKDTNEETIETNSIKETKEESTEALKSEDVNEETVETDNNRDKNEQSEQKNKTDVMDMSLLTHKGDHKFDVTLHCYLCKRPFKDPRLLPCFHTFCAKCLAEYIMSNYNNNKVNCPLCDTMTTVPEIGAKGFEKNIFLEKFNLKTNPYCEACRSKSFGIVKCIECEQTFCKECAILHSKDTQSKDHATYPINDLSSMPPRKCKIHPEKELFLFCLKCKSAICEICNMTKHKSHETQDIDSLVREIKDTLSQTLKSSERSTNLEEAVSHTENENIKLRSMENVALQGIEEHANLLYGFVQEIKRELRAEVMAAVNDNNSQLEHDASLVEKFKISVESRFKFGLEFLRSADDVDFANQGTLLNKYLLESLQSRVDLKKIKKVEFIPSQTYLLDIARLFGKVHPNKSRSDKNGKTFQLSNSFSCTLEGCIVTGLSPVTDDSVWVALGNDQVLEHFSQQGELQSSTDIGHSLDDVVGGKDGTIYISCNSGRKIITINSLGKGKTFVRTDYCPRGLALDEDGNCMVCLTQKAAFFDTTSNVDGCVSCISSGRQLRTSLRGKNIQYPARIAVNKDQSIVISDWIQLAVFVFKNNEEVGCYKGYPDLADDFIPRGICCTSDGDIIVVDIATNCLQLLSYDAVFKRVLSELEIIEEPWCVAIDGKDNLWIGTQNGKIHFANILQ